MLGGWLFSGPQARTLATATARPTAPRSEDSAQARRGFRPGTDTGLHDSSRVSEAELSP
jgi:hypothetical protein